MRTQKTEYTERTEKTRNGMSEETKINRESKVKGIMLRTTK